MSPDDKVESLRAEIEHLKARVASLELAMARMVPFAPPPWGPTRPRVVERVPLPMPGGPDPRYDPVE
ncbi:MAG: hypothetical protein AB7G11_11110 [Phycisphaerales bacterium]